MSKTFFFCLLFLFFLIWRWFCQAATFSLDLSPQFTFSLSIVNVPRISLAHLPMACNPVLNCWNSTTNGYLIFVRSLISCDMWFLCAHSAVKNYFLPQVNTSTVLLVVVHYYFICYIDFSDFEIVIKQDVCATENLFASEVLCHDPPLPGLPDHPLPVLNHNWTDHHFTGE